MTRYLQVANWKEHQHRDLADKGDMPWLKLKSGIFDDPAVSELNANQFRAYIRALTLAARTGNKMPAQANWLRAHFGQSWRQLCTTLIAKQLISGTLPPHKSLQSAGLDRADGAPIPRLEEIRGEETKAVVVPLPTQASRERPRFEQEISQARREIPKVITRDMP